MTRLSDLLLASSTAAPLGSPARVPRELSIDEGELTPTMKPKRRVVNQKFADEIEKLYAA